MSEYHHKKLLLLRGRASAASTTARWSSRVGLTDHPEFRSYLFGKLRKSTGRLNDREASIFLPRGTGLFANFQNTYRPRGDLPSLHTLDGTRMERAA